MTYKQLLNMKINQKIEVNESLFIIRVPGGWLYNSTFIPEQKQRKNIRELFEVKK